MTSADRSWLEVDTAAVVQNLRSLRRLRHDIPAMAMVKANGYGLGALPVAKAIAASGGAARLGVASLEEALEISDAGLPVQIISSLLPGEIPEAVHRSFILPLFSLEAAKLISAEACRQQRRVQCELKVDTGMGRLGFRHESVLQELPELLRLPGLRISGIFSHFPAADAPDDPETVRQIGLFRSIIGCCKDRGMDLAACHIAATDGICNYPESAARPFSLIRPGIGLYGFVPRAGEYGLTPAVDFKSRIVAVRELGSGTSIGYGRTFRLSGDGRIGIVAAGYADGIPTALANRGTFMINGVKVPVAGRVSMDHTAVLLPPDLAVRPGDEVLCFGGRGALPVEEWAKLKNTIVYDILCSFGGRVKRRYLS